MSISEIYLIIFLIGFSNCKNELIFVSTHFRHGARAPMKVDSEYKDHIKEKWLNPGELTGVGQRMHYILGLRNRIRYITDTYQFLAKKFDSHEILIYSTPFNRSILSAYAQMQGLYPESEKLGDTLREDQEYNAIPPMNITYKKIDDEIEKIKGYAMPNLMTLIPIRMINNNERKITLYDIDECEEKRDEVKEKNRKSIPLINTMEKEFNEKYGKSLNEFYGKKETYDYYFMNRFCDAVVSGVTDARNLTEFKKLNFDLNQTKEYCYDISMINYREYILGDKEHILAPVEASKMMREIIHYMKQRIDVDINQIKIEEEYLDYSKPKMLMISGHDSTISCHQVFILNSLGYDINEYFRFANYASQLALEVTRRVATADEIKKMTYSDYFVNYYFNDELIFNVTVKDFINKIEPKLWTDEQIDIFCGFKKENNNNKKNEDDNYNYSSFKFMLWIILVTLVIIFATTTVILLVKLRKMKKKIAQNETTISMVDRKLSNI